MDEKSNVWPIIIGVLILALIIIGGLWFLLSPSPTITPASQGTQAVQTASGTPASSSASSSAPMTATITYTAQGFSPTSLTIAKGTTVTFVNQSNNPMWVASNPHPVHTGYDGTSRDQHCAAGYAGPAPFDECSAVQNGGSFSFTFNKTGSWGYHNHFAHSDTGTIIVQ